MSFEVLLNLEKQISLELFSKRVLNFKPKITLSLEFYGSKPEFEAEIVFLNLFLNLENIQVKCKFDSIFLDTLIPSKNTAKALLHCAIFSATCLTMLENVALQVAEVRCLGLITLRNFLSNLSRNAPRNIKVVLHDPTFRATFRATALR